MKPFFYPLFLAVAVASCAMFNIHTETWFRKNELWFSLGDAGSEYRELVPLAKYRPKEKVVAAFEKTQELLDAVNWSKISKIPRGPFRTTIEIHHANTWASQFTGASIGGETLNYWSVISNDMSSMFHEACHVVEFSLGKENPTHIYWDEMGIWELDAVFRKWLQEQK